MPPAPTPVPPSPTPVPPTPEPPPRPSTALLVVLNHCGTPFYFTIADTMHEVPANGEVSIELAPGEHSYSITMPRMSATGGTIYVEAGQLYRFPVTCQVT